MSSVPNFSNHPFYIFLISTWFGLITGIIEISIFVYRKYILNKFILMSPNFVWMVPLAEVFLLTLAAFLLFFLSNRWPRINSLRIYTLVFTFISFLSLLLIIEGLRKYAILLLAAGLAIQVSWIIARYPDKFISLVRRTITWMVGFILVLIIVISI